MWSTRRLAGETVDAGAPGVAERGRRRTGGPGELGTTPTPWIVLLGDDNPFVSAEGPTQARTGRRSI